MSSQWDELTQCLVLPTPRLLVESEQLFRHWTWPLAARPSFPPFHLQNVHHWFQILPKTGLYFPQRGQIGVFLDQISENNFILFFYSGICHILSQSGQLLRQIWHPCVGDVHHLILTEGYWSPPHVHPELVSAAEWRAVWRWKSS